MVEICSASSLDDRQIEVSNRRAIPAPPQRNREGRFSKPSLRLYRHEKFASILSCFGHWSLGKMCKKKKKKKSFVILHFPLAPMESPGTDDKFCPDELFGYPTAAVEQVVKKIWKCVGSTNTTTKIDWERVSRKLKNIYPVTPRECQLIWRHMAYGTGDHSISIKDMYDLSDEVEYDESDIDQCPKEDDEIEFNVGYDSKVVHAAQMIQQEHQEHRQLNEKLNAELVEEKKREMTMEQDVNIPNSVVEPLPITQQDEHTQSKHPTLCGKSMDTTLLPR